MTVHRNTTRSYRVALICALGPLVTGVTIFLLWLVTRWDWLMVAGMITIYAGLGLFCIGVVALLYYCALAAEESESDLPRRQFRKSVLICAGLLLVNFPAALAIFMAAALIFTQYVVVVRNETNSPLERVHVFGGGCDVHFDAIRPLRTSTGREPCFAWQPQHPAFYRLHSALKAAVHSTALARLRRTNTICAMRENLPIIPSLPELFAPWRLGARQCLHGDALPGRHTGSFAVRDTKHATHARVRPRGPSLAHETCSEHS